MDAEERRREYREVYLRSEHWRDTRARALIRADHRCQVCNGAKNLDVHHRTYERLGEERDADLTVLCRKCHDLFHGKRHIQQAAKPKKSSKPKPKKRHNAVRSKNGLRAEMAAMKQRNRERDARNAAAARNHVPGPLDKFDLRAQEARAERNK